MPQLLLVRHGDLIGRELSALGERQADQTGRWLRNHLANGASRRVVTSTAPRARMGAGIICSHLQMAEPEAEPRLWSGPDGVAGSWEEDVDGLIDRVLEWCAEVELVVLVTHYEICASLPLRLAERLEIPGRVPGSLNRGDAWWVDLRSKAWCLL